MDAIERVREALITRHICWDDSGCSCEAKDGAAEALGRIEQLVKHAANCPDSAEWASEVRHRARAILSAFSEVV